MNEKDYYLSAIKILDHFFEESERTLNNLQYNNTWRNQQVGKLYKQAISICFLLLSNCSDSRYIKDQIVTEISIFGTLGRLIRDLYINVVYLKSTKYTEEEMRLCWEYQICLQKIKVLEFELDRDYSNEHNLLIAESESLRGKVQLLNSATRGQILLGREEKLLSLRDLADIKGFNYERFKNEYDFFSQFAHSTAFANSFIKEDGFPLTIIAVILNRIVPYYLGVVIESLDHLDPRNNQIDDLNTFYAKMIKERWQ